MRKVFVPAVMRQRVIERLKQCIEAVEKHFERDFDMPVVDYDSLTGTTAGRARLSLWMILVNSAILMRDPDRYITRTVPHEFAHLVTYKMWPNDFVRIKGEKKAEVHGPHWQQVMRILGVPEEEITRCHSYDVNDLKKDTDKSLFTYECPTCHKEWKLTARRHGKMLDYVQGIAKRNYHYVCNCAARSPLVYKDVAKHAPTQNAQKTKLKRPEPGTKLYACWNLFNQYIGKPRSYMIDVFIMEADCTRAGAGTYYALCKKMYHEGVI